MLFRIFAALALLALAAPANAQLARSFSSATYTGVGVSQVKSDFDNLGKAYNLDAIGGYNIVPAQPWGRISAELNFSATVSPGKNSGTGGTSGGVFGGGSSSTGKNTQSSSDLQALALDILAVYRTPGRLYGIGGVGYGLTSTSIQEIDDNGRTGVVFSGGVGFKFGENTAAIEAVYTQISSDLQGIGIRFVY